MTAADTGTAVPTDHTIIIAGGDGVVTSATGSTLTVDVDLHSTWSGLEFDGTELRVDLDAAFTWTGTHTFQSDIKPSATSISSGPATYPIRQPVIP